MSAPVLHLDEQRQQLVAHLHSLGWTAERIVRWWVSTRSELVGHTPRTWLTHYGDLGRLIGLADRDDRRGLDLTKEDGQCST